MAVKINRPILVYLAVFGVFAIGIWVVLALGSDYLVAPPDLSGQWRLMDENGGSGKKEFTIHQSGRFVQLNFDQGPHLDLLLQPSNPGLSMRTDPDVTLIGDGWEVIASHSSGKDTMEFAFKPPASEDQPLAGKWQYERADRPSGARELPSTAPALSHAR